MRRRSRRLLLGIIGASVLHEFLARNFVIKNKGVSFGLIVPEMVVLVLFLGLVFVWKKTERLWSELTLVIIGGAVNLIDRLRFGFVRDYWLVPGLGVYNNINDWLIFLGIIFLIWTELRWSIKTKT